MGLIEVLVGLKTAIGQQHEARRIGQGLAPMLGRHAGATATLHHKAGDRGGAADVSACGFEMGDQLPQHHIRPALFPVTARLQGTRRGHAPAIALLRVEPHEARPFGLQPVDQPMSGLRQSQSQSGPGFLQRHAVDHPDKFMGRTERIMESNMDNAARLP